MCRYSACSPPRPWDWSVKLRGDFCRGRSRMWRDDLRDRPPARCGRAGGSRRVEPEIRIWRPRDIQASGCLTLWGLSEGVDHPVQRDFSSLTRCVLSRHRIICGARVLASRRRGNEGLRDSLHARSRSNRRRALELPNSSTHQHPPGDSRHRCFSGRALGDGAASPASTWPLTLQTKDLATQSN